VSGSHRGGDRRTDSYRGSNGGQDAAGDGHRTGSGEYGQASGAHATGSGDSGRYERASGSYPSGGTRRSSTGTGGYRTASGSHRVARERRTGRRWAIVLGGVVAGAGACVLAAFAIMSGVGASGERGSGQIVGGAAESSPMSKIERSLVPDACEVADKIAGELAPGAERNQGDNYQGNDRRSQCVWGAYTGDRKRQRTVELRAIEGASGQTATGAARASFESERKADESGKALLSGQELTDKTRLTDLGDEGYVVYSVDKDQSLGEAIANARVINVLVTVHYSGANGGSPLGSSDAMDGAVEAVRSVAGALGGG
jgi:hypothetical protein